MTTVTLEDRLIVAISSRALFNLDKSNAIYEKHGEAKYAAHQISHENEILKPGIAFPLVKKLLELNKEKPLVEVILLSRNSADTGLRVFNSISHYKLDIVRAAFTNGHPPYRYAKAFAADLFLSAHQKDVKDALSAGLAAATLPERFVPSQNENKQIRIAFDGDSVLFSDEAETIYKKQGIDAFTNNEQQAAHIPLAEGPFKGFLQALQKIQQNFSDDNCPIHTALVTARQAPAHERVIRTLRSWNIRIDESLFLGGLAKGEFLKAFAADIFFDDQNIHCNSGSKYVPCGHVPYGIANSKETTELD